MMVLKKKKNTLRFAVTLIVIETIYPETLRTLKAI